MQVNDVEMCAMTHEQAVIFLRMAADTVKLRLFRDEVQTPLAATSPSSNTENRMLSNSVDPNAAKTKMCLRYLCAKGFGLNQSLF